MNGKKQFFATCVNYPKLRELERIIEKGKPISKAEFVRRCNVAQEILKDIKRFPHDYSFYKSRVRGKTVYYYEWSLMEHVFK